MRTGGCPLSPARQAQKDNADLKRRVEALEKAQADRLTPLRDLLSLVEESSRAELVYTVCDYKQRVEQLQQEVEALRQEVRELRGEGEDEKP